MNEQVSRLIDSYRDEFVSTLQAWIRVPSIKGEAAPGAPFGPEVRRMLDQAMETGRKLGFAPRDVDGYACDTPWCWRADPEETGTGPSGRGAGRRRLDPASL